MTDKLAELEERIARLERALEGKLIALDIEEDIERRYPETVPSSKKKK